MLSYTTASRDVVISDHHTDSPVAVAADKDERLALNVRRREDMQREYTLFQMEKSMTNEHPN
jgi:hypothetical protein